MNDSNEETAAASPRDIDRKRNASEQMIARLQALAAKARSRWYDRGNPHVIRCEELAAAAAFETAIKVVREAADS